MDAEAREGLIDITREDRREYFVVFSFDIPVGVVTKRHRPAAVELGGVAQGGCEVLQSLIGAPVEKGVVELGMSGDPSIAEAVGIFRVKLRRSAEAVMGGNEP